LIPRILLVLAVALSAARAGGAPPDPLAPLRSALTSMRGTQPVNANVQVHRIRKSSGRFSNNQSTGGATFGVAIDANGLHVTIAPGLLEQAAREAREREVDTKKMTPTRAALDEMELLSIAESLNFSSSLLRLLSIGTVTAEQRVVWQGRPARLVTLKLTEKLPPQATSVFNVHFADDSLRLWVAEDNTPLAAERVRKGSARFLFLRGEMNSHESWRFVRREDRLVVAHSEASFAGSGFGQRGEGRTVQTVTLR
jgi:hypothetical protein